MRQLLVLVVAALAGCGNKSKLDVDRAADVDALWDLAPDGTELGIVATPRAVGLVFDAIAAVRGMGAHPDVAPAKDQLDALAKAMFGSETATPVDAGFSGQQPFAMFATSDGVLGVMPVGDRDKFMAAKKGTRGETEDKLEANTCRMIASRYVCATKVEMFDRLGKGSLRGKTKSAGGRGDAELYMKSFALLGETKGELAVAVQLDRGQAGVHGHWAGAPEGPLGKLVGVTAPQPDSKGASGFVAFNPAPLLAGLPGLPVAGGVTLDQLAASIEGPIMAVIPSGTVDIQISIPLKDPAPATKVVENCPEIAQFFALSDKQTPGACRILLQGTNALELDIWVDGNTLRLGANKGPAPAGNPAAMTALGRELAAGSWTGALWGRGTMLNLSGIKPAEQDVPPQVALGVHAMGLVNELGAAAKVEATGIRFRGFIRTAFANPPDVVASYVQVGGADILSGKATEAGKALAARAPTSTFAGDFAAGQGGLMIPAAAIGLVSAVVIPAVLRYLSGEAPPDEASGSPPPMDKAQLALLLVRAFAEEAYPMWKTEHPNEKCPAKLDELAKYFGDDPMLPVLEDPWQRPLVMECKDGKLVVISAGEDGQHGTADDVRSQ